MYKVRNCLLPSNILNIFKDRDGNYDLRAELNFKKVNVRTAVRQMSISISGVHLWNGLGDEYKKCINQNRFKKLYKENFLELYRQEM